MIRIRLLGRFAVEHDGQEIPLGSFGGRLARRLLRLLALRRGTLVPQDLIAGALWPDNPPADPAGNIEVLVSRIRRALGERTLVRPGPGGYVLADGSRCWVDAEAFLAAVQAGRAALALRPAGALGSFRAALGIWRGEPLPEDTYADWATEAAGIAARIGHAEWTAAAYRGLGIACEAAGLPGRAESAYRRSLQTAEGTPLFRAWAAARLGACLARQGQPAEAAPHVQAALAGETPLTRHEARWAHAELLASQGDDQACRETAVAALDQAQDSGYLILVPRLRQLAGG